MVFKRFKRNYNKMMDSQAEAPYRLQKKLKEGWTAARHKSKTFNKFSKGVEKVKGIAKKAYKSKFSKSIGKRLDTLEKIPFVGGEVKDVRKLAKGVVKDPFALKSNLLNLTRVLPMSGMSGKVAELVAGKLKNKALDKIEKPLARREQRARDRVFGSKSNSSSEKLKAIPKPQNKNTANVWNEKAPKTSKTIPRRRNGGIRPPYIGSA